MLGHDDIVRSALGLPEDERAEVARKIIESLHGAPDEAVEQAWAAEVGKRLADLSSGKASTITAEEALSQARSRIDR